jgi:hypothetical protein
MAGKKEQFATNRGRYRVDKRLLYETVDGMHKLGLGGEVIGRILGYSKGYINLIKNDLYGRLPYACSAFPDMLILNGMEPELRKKAFSIRLRNMQYMADHGKELPARFRTVNVSDPDADPCVNDGGAVRPKEAA